MRTDNFGCDLSLRFQPVLAIYEPSVSAKFLVKYGADPLYPFVRWLFGLLLNLIWRNRGIWRRREIWRNREIRRHRLRFMGYHSEKFPRNFGFVNCENLK